MKTIATLVLASFAFAAPVFAQDHAAEAPATTEAAPAAAADACAVHDKKACDKAAKAENCHWDAKAKACATKKHK